MSTTACIIDPPPGYITGPRCTCHDGWWGVTPPPPCPVHNQWTILPITAPVTSPSVTVTSAWPLPDPQRLHPDDIEAIAQRVAAIVKPKRRAKR